MREELVKLWNHCTRTLYAHSMPRDVTSVCWMRLVSLTLTTGDRFFLSYSMRRESLTSSSSDDDAYVKSTTSCLITTTEITTNDLLRLWRHVAAIRIVIHCSRSVFWCVASDGNTIYEPPSVFLLLVRVVSCFSFTTFDDASALRFNCLSSLWMKQAHNSVNACVCTCTYLHKHIQISKRYNIIVQNGYNSKTE